MSEETGAEASTALATLGGGCFWCLEAVFEQLAGVERVVSGYAGGDVADPTYRAVCTGTTGHAEVVQIHFDPTTITYEDLLRVFFVVHDPTTLDRQGADVGSQYRSVVFHHDAAQEAKVREVIAELERDGVWDDPIVTQVLPAPTFYPAEAYHQGYYRANSEQPYCRITIQPKVAKLRRLHLQRLKPEFQAG